MLLLFSTLLGCGGADEADAGCGAWSAARGTGVVPYDALDEASGLARSPTHDGVLWTHNDKGDSARLFAIGADASAQGELVLVGSAPVDWEDIASAEGGWLYVGDIGDNDAERETIAIWRVAEPATLSDTMSASEVQVAAFRYPDGPRDAETLLHDPLTDQLFVLTKARGTAELFAVGALDSGNTNTLTHVADVSLPDGARATGGDVAADGRRILVRTDDTVLVWSRAPGQTLADALAVEPCAAPAPPEQDGESIAATATGYASLSEGARPTLWQAEGP
jgi:hypothetical protein